MSKREREGFLTIWLVSVVIIVISYGEDAILYMQNRQSFGEVAEWLQAHSPGSERNEGTFYDAGITSLQKLCVLSVDEFRFLSYGSQWQSDDPIGGNLLQLKRQMIAKFWLKSYSIDYQKFSKLGIETLKQIASEVSHEKLLEILEEKQSKIQRVWQGIQHLKTKTERDLDSYPVEPPSYFIVQLFAYIWGIVRILAKIIFWLGLVLAVFVVVILVFLYQAFKHGIEAGFRRLGNALATGSRNIFRNQLPQAQQPLPGQNTATTQSNSTGETGFWRNMINALLGRASAGPSLPFNPNNTKLEFSWKDENATVGEMHSFTIKFYSKFLMACPCSYIHNARVVINCESESELVPCTIEESSSYAFQVKFTPTIAASHRITIFANGHEIMKFCKVFAPGVADPLKTNVKIASSMLVLKQNMPVHIILDERDKYGNRCKSSEDSLIRYTFKVLEVRGDCPRINPAIGVEKCDDNYVVMMRFRGPGCYKTTVTYRDENIGNNVFDVLVLNASDWDKMKSNVSSLSWNLYYEAYLLPRIDDIYGKRRKVYIYITPKQLLIKEYYLKFIPKRLHTMRIRTSLKLSVLPSQDQPTGYPLLSIKEGINSSLLIACKERNLLLATYSEVLLRNIGGSDSFENKKKHFYSEIRQIYAKKSGSRVTLTVHRDQVLTNLMKATKTFTALDWGKQLSVDFVGEMGLDYGGLKRELFQLVCDALFRPQNHLFRNFGKENAQSLVHPNPYRPEQYAKLKYFEFAGKIVGKFLIECAHSRQQYVKARFSRAFLTQIIGLPVSWQPVIIFLRNFRSNEIGSQRERCKILSIWYWSVKDFFCLHNPIHGGSIPNPSTLAMIQWLKRFMLFESDDKELYKTKVLYILKNDPQDLELTFTEDVYDNKENFVKTVELKPYGSQIQVTNDNKLEYLQLVAEYRMTKCVTNEITEFLKGLNSLIPEKLLSMFDETELELLICGADQISASDLKENFRQAAGGEVFLKKLPPGGFKELDPTFQIMAFPGIDVLPSAHTCFNMLCLPDYSSKAEFKRLLLIALNEGSEGFGLV